MGSTCPSCDAAACKAQLDGRGLVSLKHSLVPPGCVCVQSVMCVHMCASYYMRGIPASMCGLNLPVMWRRRMRVGLQSGSKAADLCCARASPRAACACAKRCMCVHMCFSYYMRGIPASMCGLNLPVMWRRRMSVGMQRGAQRPRAYAALRRAP